MNFDTFLKGFLGIFLLSLALVIHGNLYSKDIIKNILLTIPIWLIIFSFFDFRKWVVNDKIKQEMKG